MNQRPLGYEGKSSHDDSQDEPSQPNDDKALPSRLVGPLWLISVALLHSRFIAVPGHNDGCGETIESGDYAFSIALKNRGRFMFHDECFDVYNRLPSDIS